MNVHAYELEGQTLRLLRDEALAGIEGDWERKSAALLTIAEILESYLADRVSEKTT